jgi:hypothetical protein
LLSGPRFSTLDSLYVIPKNFSQTHKITFLLYSFSTAFSTVPIILLRWKHCVLSLFRLIYIPVLRILSG